ncbi:hypothetical protein Tsubulata_000452 [Turnera subulata]|uniref:Glutaredoxin domain-containing protein n=1 Tax=Turnera subulata TaxID=218843 RepID=A0A9Q0FZ05_9ROSI|nr:hypothetical protein Tsubulata_000452 [Turnera subulata]
MWRSRGKSPVKVHDTTSPTSPFSFSTFKDIQHLCTDDCSSASPSPSPSASPSPTATTPFRRSSSVFHRVRLATSLLRSLQPPKPPLPPPPQPAQEPPQQQPPSPPLPAVAIPDAENSIVVYFTSLRVVRSVFEDCKSVRSILRGFRVTMDERDLSMDSSFLGELQQIFSAAGAARPPLPIVFIGGRYVGGAEEIRQLHEVGELKKIVEGLPEGDTGVCEACGGHGFVVCEDCNGSHKLYTEKTGFKTCTACNENGLVRCPSCPCTLASL